jgi:hypothetical protein
MNKLPFSFMNKLAFFRRWLITSITPRRWLITPSFISRSIMLFSLIAYTPYTAGSGAKPSSGHSG